MEEWKEIEGYKCYLVSNEGRVKSIDRVIITGKGAIHRTEKELKPSINDKGYYSVCLPNNNKKAIHRLVAEAFIPIPDELKKLIGTQKLHVNHKDEDKLNNKVENLEWCDITYNVNYGTARKRMAKTNSKPVYKYIDNKLVEEFESLKEAEEKTNTDGSTISYHIRKGTIDKRNNCYWSYTKKEDKS